MSEINIIEHTDGELRVSSFIIAEQTERDHEPVLRLIRDNVEDFESFGRVSFENGPFATAGGVQRKSYALLNEQQATLLITFMRNTPVVRAFKVALIQEFYRMRQALNEIAIPRTLPEALRAYAAEVERTTELEAKISADAPKVHFAEAVAASPSTILVGDLAKILRANGCTLGANRLFEKLRADGYLIRRRGSDWNMPTQKSMELGLFEIKESTRQHPDGHVLLTKTPKVTGKGQQYFIEKYAPRDVLALDLEEVAA